MLWGNTYSTSQEMCYVIILLLEIMYWHSIYILSWCIHTYMVKKVWRKLHKRETVHIFNTMQNVVPNIVYIILMWDCIKYASKLGYNRLAAYIKCETNWNSFKNKTLLIACCIVFPCRLFCKKLEISVKKTYYYLRIEYTTTFTSNSDQFIVLEYFKY